MSKRPKIIVTFPNILLIPLLSAVFGVVKACGGAGWDWANALVFFPIAAYFAWCAGYCALALFAVLIAKITENRHGS